MEAWPSTIALMLAIEDNDVSTEIGSIKANKQVMLSAAWLAKKILIISGIEITYRSWNMLVQWMESCWYLLVQHTRLSSL